MSATIKDVARLAGCSPKTVSRVINDEPYVTEDLRARVKAAIRAVGYAPNISARRLIQNKSFVISILMYPGFHQSSSSVLSRVMDITYEEEYDILIQPYFPTHKRSRNRLVELITQRRVDGFVITPPCDADGFAVDMISTYKVPLVQINPLVLREDLPSISGDDYAGAFIMTEHLIDFGHRRIAFLMGPRNMRSSFDRLNGYRAALQAHDIPFEEGLEEDSEFTSDGGYTATRLLLDRSPQPTAIFAGSDEAALGAIYALQEAGLQIPDDMSVSGYDDFPLSKIIWPGLTTVRQPADQMIELATRTLIRILEGEPPIQLQQVLTSNLVIRRSTGAPPAGDYGLTETQ